MIGLPQKSVCSVAQRRIWIGPLNLPALAFFAALILIFFQTSFDAEAKETGTVSLSSKDISSFADHLYSEEDYYRAITEYKRLIFHFPESSLAKDAKLKIARAYMEGKRYEAALSAFEEFVERYKGDHHSWQALFLMGETNYRGGDYEEAIRFFSEVEKEAPSSDLRESALMRKGWGLVKMGRWAEASKLFNSVAGSDSRTKGLAKELIGAEGLKEKSPSLAGTLSAILPGAGQLYVGRKRDAVVSFLLNGAFILGAVEAFDKDENALGGILAFFEAGWYAGNIYSAVGGAHKYNRKIKDDFIYRLERRYSFGVNGQGDLLGVVSMKF